mmetsp:Transcript_87200/g.195348  ORF Transcript_87200/g.195348 Transcript_87200/m.195348 type:complete len:222 (-) Transcript_87200:710-1375(-)
MPLRALHVDLHIRGERAPPAQGILQAGVAFALDHGRFRPQADAVGLIRRSVASLGTWLTGRARFCRIWCLPTDGGRSSWWDETVEELRGNMAVIAHPLAPHVALLDTEGKASESRRALLRILQQGLLTPDLVSKQEKAPAVLLGDPWRRRQHDSLAEINAPLGLPLVWPDLRRRHARDPRPRTYLSLHERLAASKQCRLLRSQPRGWGRLRKRTKPRRRWR